MTPSIFDAPEPVAASRIKKSRAVWRALFRVQTMTQRALRGRRLSDRERAWHQTVEVGLQALIDLGDRELPVYSEPRLERRARKRG